ncbi:MAG: response regulator transcription factor [Lachnospiraceae bacterium]|nr:response regulator transcription factor [Lachnospiraceae bacterium]
MNRILVIEDDKNMAKELVMLLRRAGYEADVLSDFRYPIEEIRKRQPDLILLDMNLPEMDGLSIIRRLREESDVPVIFVTGNTTSMDELNCMMQGGDDYIAKPYQAPILLARVAAVLKRYRRSEAKEETKLVQKGVTLDLAAATVTYEGKQEELSKNELKILYYLFTHPGIIAKRVEIIEFLWDQQMFIDDNTLSVNMTRIRNKLANIGVKDFIETKRGMGYKI